MHDGDIVTVELQPHADSRTIIGLDIGFVETYTAAIYLRLQNIDFGGMAIAALVHDPDLITVTRANPSPRPRPNPDTNPNPNPNPPCNITLEL